MSDSDIGMLLAESLCQEKVQAAYPEERQRYRDLFQ